MANDVTTQHFVVDLKTGFSYGLRLDAEGNCKAIQPMNTVIEKFDGMAVNIFGPQVGINADDPAPPLPFGQTITAVEMIGNKPGQIFTMVWPSEEDFAKGVRPEVTRQDQPSDLIRAGLAPNPKNTKAKKAAGITSEEQLKEALKDIDGMIGLDRAKHDIKQNIAVARFNMAKEEMGLPTKPISRHMVFTGNPGTGKTTFAREVAEVYYALGFIEKPTVLEVKREDLVAGYVGQTALKTKEVIEKAKGGILFIDEAYALSRAGDTPGGSNDFGREAIDTLVAAMENMREDLVVIVAGYSEPMKRFIDANEGLKSRFMTYIEFEDYTLPQLGQILDVMVKDRGYALDADARAYAMKLLEAEKNRAQKKDFGNGRTVRNLVEKAEKELAMRLEREGKLAVGHGGLTEEAFKKELTTITLADVEKISLAGIESKADSYQKIGFGKAATRKPAPPAPSNDIIPPPLVGDEMKLKPVRPPRIGFGA